MTLQHPWVLLAAPLVAALLVTWDTLRRRRVGRLAEAVGMRSGLPRASVRTALAVAAGVLAVLALAGPGVRVSSRPGDGGSPDGSGVLDLVLAVDVSRSMAADDGAPHRAAAARLAATRLATLPGAARVGLVAFASRAHLLVPPTGDRGLVQVHLDGLEPEAFTAQGTDLAAGLEAALDAAAGAGGASARAVILVSDGEGFEAGTALPAALARAGREGVPVHTVMVGTPAGAPVPGAPGETTRARPEVMERIAAATGGRSARASEGVEMAALVEALEGGEGARPGQAPGSAPLVHLAPALALLAALALVAEGALGRSLPWSRR